MLEKERERERALTGAAILKVEDEEGLRIHAGARFSGRRRQRGPGIEGPVRRMLVCHCPFLLDGTVAGELAL